MKRIFPVAEEIIEISESTVARWHKMEAKLNLSSFEEILKIFTLDRQDDLLNHVEMLSLINTLQWHEEDKARDLDIPAFEIAEIKRNIDKLNAKRVRTVEYIDDLIYERIVLNNNAPLNTETVGSVIDRLTILYLKQYHMDHEASRFDSTEEHRLRCKVTLSLINKQMNDLKKAYNFFIKEIESGKRRFSLYKQFKMYNDSNLNPVLYKKECKN